ncbi:MAG TPA: hypothetical protein VGN52_07075 [Burkholderiales bacterium]|jgi:hypothetical protein
MRKILPLLALLLPALLLPGVSFAGDGMPALVVSYDGPHKRPLPCLTLNTLRVDPVVMERLRKEAGCGFVSILSEGSEPELDRVIVELRAQPSVVSATGMRFYFVEGTEIYFVRTRVARGLEVVRRLQAIYPQVNADIEKRFITPVKELR